MFSIRNYVVAESLEQAYELNQKRNNVILGGIGWLKMVGRNIQTAIDLSALGLDKIEEDDECFKIGCMCTLRQLETDESLNSYFDGIIKKSVILKPLEGFSKVNSFLGYRNRPVFQH